MNIKQNIIEIQGIRTHYWDAGDGPSTVVLLHGGGVDSADLSWGLLLPELAAKQRVIAFDWPGYGESDRLPRDYSISFYIHFLTAFLDALGIQRVHLAGLSMGGALALGFTLKSPERVEKLVLVDSYGLQRVAPFKRLGYLMIHTPGLNDLTYAMMRSSAMTRASLKMLLLRPGSVTDELVEKAVRELRKPHAVRAWTTFQRSEMMWSGTRTCYMDRLGEIDKPVLIIHGSKDSAVPVTCASEAHARISGSQLVWMDGCGHWPQRDDSKTFNKAIISFLCEEYRNQ